MRPERTKNTSVCRGHTPANLTKDETKQVDISRSEQVETDLDRLIERRHDQRVLSEGERATEALWAESVRRYNACQEDDHRAAWREYEMHLYRIHSGLAAEHLARAERLEANGHENGTKGDAA
jgi:hypothetical protein